MDRFIADLHFNHKNILKYDNRSFNAVEEMNQVIIKNWNSIVKENDNTYILGDIGFGDTKILYNLLKQLKGNLILIKGNHDNKVLKDYNVKKLFTEITDYKEITVDNKKVILCHYPIFCYNGAYRDSYMLYGHVHNSQDWLMIEKCKELFIKENMPCNMFNVGCCIPKMNYFPRTLKEITS